MLPARLAEVVCDKLSFREARGGSINNFPLVACFSFATTLTIAKLAKAKLAKPKLPTVTQLTQSLFGVLAPVSFWHSSI